MVTLENLMETGVIGIVRQHNDTPAYPLARVRHEDEPYYSNDELDLIFSVWNRAPVKDKRNYNRRLSFFYTPVRVSITDNEVDIPSMKGSQKAVYESMVSHAKTVWNNEPISIYGTENFKAELWAYMTAAGVAILNYTPLGPMLEKANRILAALKGEQAPESTRSRQPVPANTSANPTFNAT